MRLAPWLPPVLWMAVTAWLSTDIASGEHTSQLLLPALRWLLPWATPGQLHTVHRLLRKGAHLTEYAILAALWYRAFTRERNLSARAASWTAFAISLAWAALDEWHQSFLPSRTSSAMDVALDGAGAALALVVDWRARRGVLDRATPLLFWLPGGRRGAPGAREPGGRRAPGEAPGPPPPPPPPVVPPPPP